MIFLGQNDQVSTHAGTFATFGFAHESGFFADFKLGGYFGADAEVRSWIYRPEEKSLTQRRRALSFSSRFCVENVRLGGWGFEPRCAAFAETRRDYASATASAVFQAAPIPQKCLTHGFSVAATRCVNQRRGLDATRVGNAAQHALDRRLVERIGVALERRDQRLDVIVEIGRPQMFPHGFRIVINCLG